MEVIQGEVDKKKNKWVLLSLRKKRILFYYVCNTRRAQSHFICHHLGLCVIFFFCKSKWSEIWHDHRGHGSEPQEYHHKSLPSSSPEGIHIAKLKHPSNTHSGKAASPQHKYFPVTDVILKICKCTLTCFGAAEKNLSIKDCFQLYRVFDCEQKYSGNKYSQVLWLVPAADKSSPFCSGLTSSLSLFLKFCINTAGLISLPGSNAFSVLIVLESKDSDSHKH